MTTKANPALGQSAGLGKMSGDQHDPPSIAPNRSGRQDPSANFPTPDEPAPPAAMRNGHAVETYDSRAAFEWAYVDESGAPLFRSIRRPEKQFWQSPADGKGGWVKPAKGCMDGVRLVPLYLPEVLAAIRNSGLIFIAEGERKADLLRHWGFVATCNSSGAARSKLWFDHAKEFFSAACYSPEIIVLPDNDDAGRKHADTIGAAFAAVGRTIRILDLPGLENKEDVLDWYDRGGTREQLDDLIGSDARPWEPGKRESVNAGPSSDSYREQRKPVPVKIYTYDEMVALPEADFLIDGVIVRRGKNVIFGASNTFKSFHAVDLGCSVSTGRSYHGKTVRKMKVFYAANEGAIGIGRKRIAAWMAYHGIPQAERRNIFLIRDETIIPDEASRNNLIACIRLLVEPGEDFFIIFDIHRGTKNAPDKDDDAADAWIKGAEILIKEGATTLSIAHSPYGDDARARGSSHQWGSWDGRLQSEGDKEKRTSILKVDRFKDHESCGQFGFTLDEQEVEEHPGEFSLVPRLDGTVKQGKTRPKNLPKNADLALSALKYALDEVGAIPPACNHIPANTKCVTVQQWREYSYMQSGADKPDTKLKEFVRGCEYLSADGSGKIVAILGAYAWLT